MADIPTRIRMAIAYANITYGELGRDLNVSAITVSRWTSGHRSPTAAHLVAIAKQCQVPLLWLLGQGSTFPSEHQPKEPSQ